MPKFMCIRSSQVRKETSDGKLGAIYYVTAGTVEVRKNCPNHHWVPLGESEASELWDILAEKLIKLDVEVDDTWNTDHMQKLLAEKQAEANKDNEKKLLQEALEEVGIKYHHKAGVKSLRKLAKENHIEM